MASPEPISTSPISTSQAPQPLVVDGSQGEGGGQIVRTSLSLSLVTGREVRVHRIRAGRRRSGLLQQHLTALRAAAEISRAAVQVGQLHSSEFTFAPGPVRAGEYAFRIGSAGSATLVLQTVLPALMLADGPSRVTVEGGTHNQWAPPFDFLERVYLPLIRSMGPRVDAKLEQHGFYPAGGGRIVLEIEPAARLNGLELLEPGELRRQRVTSLVASLPRHIGEREVNTVLRRLDWPAKCGRVLEVSSPGPGNVVYAELEQEHLTELFTAYGRIGIRAEHVAKEVVREVREYLAAGVAVGPHLADQLLLPLGISAWQEDPPAGPTSHGPPRRRGGRFWTTPLSSHTTTQIDLLRYFLGINIQVATLSPNRIEVQITRPVHEQ